MILKFALGSKISYNDEYLSSESEKNNSNTFNSKTKCLFTFFCFSCDGGIFILARLLGFIKIRCNYL